MRRLVRLLWAWPAPLCVAALALAAPAQAAPEDPLFVYRPAPPPPPAKPAFPQGHFEAPCGLAVDTAANLYVSDYYHDAVHVFDMVTNTDGPPVFVTQRTPVDPLDGPCGLALDAAGGLYVNDYHRWVGKFVPSEFPPMPEGTSFPFTPATSYSSAGVIDSDHPTGVAVDRATGVVYVNARTHIAAYDASGAPILDEGQPLRIGEGAVGDGYGVAVSDFAGTLGRVYVADAADGLVKAFDPLVDPDVPAATIAGPGAGFGSLRDSALAVDDASGELYVADTLGPQHSESPLARIEVFNAAGAHLGHLKHEVIDGGPTGLAVDNSATPTQGRVYVTSGNTELGSLYAYPPEAATTASPQPPLVASAAASPGTADADLAAPGGEESSVRLPAAAASFPAARPLAEILQKGSVRVKVSAELRPRRLPRRGAAPISIAVGGRISTTDGSRPPRLVRMLIELNRRGRLDTRGLPTCPYDRIQPASTSRALAACREALVGRGSFAADISLAGQEPYPAKGRLLLFNGVRRGKPVLYGQIYSARPFATSFVIVFAIKRISRGPYGTALSAQLPRALGSWGTLRSIEMTLKRRYRHRGAPHSYISAGCPAPQGFPGAIFPLARASFSFADGKRLSSSLVGECRVKNGDAR